MRPILSSRTVLIFALSSLVPAVAIAQSRHAIAFHLGRNDALPTEATLGGLSYTSWAGMLGVRGSGALSLGRVDRTASNADGTMKITAWTADADVMLSPFRILPPVVTLGFRPFALAGIGGHGARYPAGDRAAVATLSYGWGLAWNLSRALSIESTARRRTLLLKDEVDLPPGFANDWEYRVGVGIEFGGRRQADRPVRRRRDPVRDPHHDREREPMRRVRTSGLRSSPSLAACRARRPVPPASFGQQIDTRASVTRMAERARPRASTARVSSSTSLHGTALICREPLGKSRRLASRSPWIETSFARGICFSSRATEPGSTTSPFTWVTTASFTRPRVVVAFESRA